MRRLTTAVLMFLVAATAGASCVTPQWYEPTARNSASAISIVAADLDGDGVLESAVGLTRWGVTVVPITISGAGTYRIVYQNARYADGLATGDFTGDGKVDILLSDRDARQLIVLAGNGDGTFSATPIVTTLPEFPHVLASGDFDRDGKLDAVVAVNDIQKVIIYKGDGVGHFAEASRSDIDPAANAMTAADLDGDGSLDLVVTHEYSAVVDVLFGNGDGTLGTSNKITGKNYAVAVKAVDVDNDGDLDLAFAINSSIGTLAVIANFGGRTFGSPAMFGIPPYGTSWSIPVALAVADFNGDGKTDITVVTSYGYILTMNGNGTGFFGDPTPVFTTGPVASVDVVDYNNDGRPDLLLSRSSYYQTTAVRNRCGDSNVSLFSGPPTVSVGQTFTASVSVSGVASNARKPTGTVELRSGSAVLASGTLVNGSITFKVSDAPPADHSLIAWYLGDEEYEPTKSTAVLQRVTTDTTTTVVTIPKTQYEYGQSIPVTATVTSSAGDTPAGSFYFSVDGVETSYTYGGSGSSTTYTAYAPAIGSHTYSARYVGDATHPPSGPSAPVSIAVVKAKPRMYLSWVTYTAVPGSKVIYGVDIENAYSGAKSPTGTVTFYDGSTPLQTTVFPDPNGTYYLAKFEITTLALGTHYLHADYSGDDYYVAASGPMMTTIVYPSTGTSFDARGDATGIRVYWNGFASSYPPIYRAVQPNGLFQYTSIYSPGSQDSGVSADKVYLYRIDTWSGSQQVPAMYDVAQMVSFTDDPLTPGTVMKAVHIAEIVTALNSLRAAAQLPTVSLTIAPGQLIHADEILALRGWIAEARKKLAAYPVTFSNAVAPGEPIRAIDIQELREAIR